MIEYGKAPKPLGIWEPECDEMMAYLYLPVMVPGLAINVPQRLDRFRPMIVACIDDFHDISEEHYVYLTAKTLWVEPGNPGNRPGWHVDGWGSGGDINYVWSDMNPTEFAVQTFIDIPDDDRESMVAMSGQVNPDRIVTYPDKTLLRLDEGVVHRVGPVKKNGYRSFVKVTISRHRFDMKLNSKNYVLGTHTWDTHDRGENRNTDVKGIG